MSIHHSPGAGDLLRVENLRVSFGDHGDQRSVVKGVSFSLAPGKCLAIVGESGSGKSVTARTLVGLTGGRSHVWADRLEFDGRGLSGLSTVNGGRYAARTSASSCKTRSSHWTSFARSARRSRRLCACTAGAHGRAAPERAVELLELVGVPEPKVRARQRPYELSGGLRQRALIASALSLDPKLVIADEPTTALDVTVQAQVLDQLEATKRRGKALILISHDLAVVSRLADTVAVMSDGEILEYGPARELFNRPKHEYTQALIDAIPSAESRGARLSPVSRRVALGQSKPFQRSGSPGSPSRAASSSASADPMVCIAPSSMRSPLRSSRARRLGSSASRDRARRLPPGSRSPSLSRTEVKCVSPASPGPACPSGSVASVAARSPSSIRIRSARLTHAGVSSRFCSIRSREATTLSAGARQQPHPRAARAGRPRGGAPLSPPTAAVRRTAPARRDRSRSRSPAASDRLR